MLCMYVSILDYPPYTKTGLLGGEQDQLLIKLHAVETAGLGGEGKKKLLSKTDPIRAAEGKS